MWYNGKENKEGDYNQMKKKETKVKKQRRPIDKGQVFVKIMAGILAVLMVAGTGITLVYALLMK